jgi:hypothetical protein
MARSFSWWRARRKGILRGGPRRSTWSMGEVAAWWWTPGSGRRLVGEDEGPATLLAGRGVGLEEQWLGESYAIRPGAFLQVNREAAEILHDLALRELGLPRGGRMVDAYCGAGVYGRRHGPSWRSRGGDRSRSRRGGDGPRAGPVEGFRVLEGLVEDRLSEALPATWWSSTLPGRAWRPSVAERWSDAGTASGSSM